MSRTRLKKIRLTELSLVDRPANPHATVLFAKRAGVVDGVKGALTFRKVLDLIRKYREDQERDERGRWVDEGSGSGGGGLSQHPAKGPKNYLGWQDEPFGGTNGLSQHAMRPMRDITPDTTDIGSPVSKPSYGGRNFGPWRSTPKTEYLFQVRAMEAAKTLRPGQNLRIPHAAKGQGFPDTQVTHDEFKNPVFYQPGTRVIGRLYQGKFYHSEHESPARAAEVWRRILHNARG